MQFFIKRDFGFTHIKISNGLIKDLTENMIFRGILATTLFCVKPLLSSTFLI